MINKQSIYDKSPRFLQERLVKFSGYLKVRQRYGASYHEHRAWLRDYDTWSLDRMLSHQNDSLERFIKSAVNESVFYQEQYKDISVSDVRTPKDLSELPILEKEALRSHITEVYTVDRRRAVEGHTGGTTGKSLVVRYTLEDHMRRMAMLDHFKSRHGFENRKMRKATFSGKHIVSDGHKTRKYWRYNSPAKQMLYSTFHINEESAYYYVRHLNEYKPTALDGFVSSMIDIASYIERNGVSLKFEPIAIFPTAETVTPGGRALLERVFGAKVYDQYASSEGAPFVTECPAGVLHEELSTGVFENLSRSNEILVTSFHTRGTPLIRYRIGDSMRFSTRRNCPCGSPSPQVAAIEGRSSDYLMRGDGAKVNSVQVANLFKNIPNSVIQAQAVQTQVGEVIISVVVDDSSDNEGVEAQLRHEFMHAFDSKTVLRIRRVQDIPRESSGKQRLIRNLISDASH